MQLYLSVDIPTFPVILALLIALFQNNRLADKLDRVADRLAGKIEAMNSKIEAINNKIEAVRIEHHADFMMLAEQIVRLNERVAKVEN